MTGLRHDITVSITSSVDVCAEARAISRRFLEDRLEGGALDDALLLASELVSNAVRHGGASETVPIELGFDERSYWMSVTQPGPFGDPVPGASGWGLHIIERLSMRWGVRCDGRHSVTWIEVDVPMLEVR